MASRTSWSSSSFAYQWKYDVFLSFRGEDTRTGFTGNLYHALRQKKIDTFMDDQELGKGEEITPALMEAIQESRIAIVVFSENYASSTFCLQELVKIMECLKHEGRLVWPVFYEVDPSDVRHQNGSYGDALAKHETRITDKDKVKKWRSALKEAASLSGSHYKQGYEYEFIGEIIQEVSKKISREPLHVAKYPVGLESRVHKVMSLLDVKSSEGVDMVGIYGIGGIGKTTLACAVYNSVADQFEGLSFLADIRENSVKHGLVHLQEKLLYDIFGEKDIRLGSAREGIPIIKKRLREKKILLILDDVDAKEQLEVLAGGLDWFGSGSRIIITTRDKHLLCAHGVQRRYEAEGLNNEEALELFSWNAFRQKEVNPSYQGISERVIRHSNGLPLSVEIIGSDIFGKSVLECNSALDAYEIIPRENIRKILKVSYDGLEEIQKEVFLDMACFFNGCFLGHVTNILDSGRGYNTEYHIGVLIDKCLIKVVQQRVRIHNLIENMGKDIVQRESPSKPRERSRLWFSKDILRVFKENKGSDKTEIIMLHLPECKDVQWDGNALRKMENLKILVLKNARFCRAPTALPKSLRVLIWWGYPESSLPADFNPKKLVILDLPQSFFTFNNQLNMKFKSLTKMNLSGCDLLTEVPDMSGAQNLKELYLFGCQNLVKVQDSVGFLDKLERLDLSGCTSLRILPREINLTSLQHMTLQNCTSLRSFPEVLGKMENIYFLELNRSGIRDLPFSIRNLTDLYYLGLRECNWLVELPSSIFMLSNVLLDAENCYQLAQINNGNSQDQETMCSGAREEEEEEEEVVVVVKADFNFDHCPLITDKFLDTLILLCLRDVTKLSLGYTNITILPSSISACLSLTQISLNECKKLQEIRLLPPNIEYLSAGNCTSLTPESKRRLMNQTLHEAGNTYFQFPGPIIISSWFNFTGWGPSLRFWFRNELPAIILCANGFFAKYISLKLIINGESFSWDNICYPNFDIQHFVPQTEHTILCYPLSGFECNFRDSIKKGWNSAEMLWEDDRGSIIDTEWGVHVLEQETNMEDIQFTNPDISVEEKQILNQFSSAHREGAGPSSISEYMEQMECTENSPENYFEARSTSLSNKKRKHGDDLYGYMHANFSY